MKKMNDSTISHDFTVEDIHKIREQYMERWRAIGDEAFLAEVRAGAFHMEERIREIRERKRRQESVAATLSAAAAT